MDAEFTCMFAEVGWTNVPPVNEDGVRLLTIEFLCTLKFTNTGVEFRMFNRKFSLSWSKLSNHFGFNADCVLDLDSVTPEYNKEQFWKEISDLDICHKPKMNDIQLPTLRFMHCWIAMTLFPRPDPRTAREDELKLLYAMVKIWKVSPVVNMMYQWLDVFGPLKGAVECISLVTRLANRLDLMENSLVQNIPGGRIFLNFDYFRQAQILKRVNGVIHMMYHGMITEIPLPNPGLGIYSVRNFLVGLQPLPTLRSASTCLANMPRTRYYGADDTPEGPAYTRYADWGQAESSRHAQGARSPWEQQQPQYSDGSWQAPSEEWQRKNRFDQYQPRRSVDHQEASSSRQRQEPARQSFSGIGYHDDQMERRNIGVRLTNIEEEQAAIQRSIEEQQQWNAQFGTTLNTILQNQEQTN